MKCSWEDILENVFLRGSQASRELDVHADNKVATFTGFSGDGHSQVRIMFLVVRLRRTWLRDTDGLALDRGHNALPTSQSFFEGQVDCCNEIVAHTLEIGVLDL